MLDEAAKLDPSNYRVRKYLADAYKESKIYDEALYNYEIALSLQDFVKWYNEERIHHELANDTPEKVYWEKV